MSPKLRWIFYQPVFYDHSAAKFDWSTTIWCTIFDVSKPRHFRSVLHIKCQPRSQGPLSGNEVDEMSTTPRGFETKNQVAIFISNHSCYTQLHGGTLLSEMDSVMKWSFNWFLIDQEPFKKFRTNFTSITESWMVPLKSTSIGVLLFVKLTDVPEVKKK